MIHKRGVERQKNQNHRDSVRRKTQPVPSGFNNGVEPLAKECRQPLEARKGKKTDYPLEFYWCLHFSPMKSLQTSGLELYDDTIR